MPDTLEALRQLGLSELPAGNPALVAEAAAVQPIEAAALQRARARLNRELEPHEVEYTLNAVRGRRGQPSIKEQSAAAFQAGNQQGEMQAWAQEGAEAGFVGGGINAFNQGGQGLAQGGLRMLEDATRPFSPGTADNLAQTRGIVEQGQQGRQAFREAQGGAATAGGYAGDVASILAQAQTRTLIPAIGVGGYETARGAGLDPGLAAAAGVGTAAAAHVGFKVAPFAKLAGPAAGRSLTESVAKLAPLRMADATVGGLAMAGLQAPITAAVQGPEAAGEQLLAAPEEALKFAPMGLLAMRGDLAAQRRFDATPEGPSPALAPAMDAIPLPAPRPEARTFQGAEELPAARVGMARANEAQVGQNRSLLRLEEIGQQDAQLAAEQNVRRAMTLANRRQAVEQGKAAEVADMRAGVEADATGAIEAGQAKAAELVANRKVAMQAASEAGVRARRETALRQLEAEHEADLEGRNRIEDEAYFTRQADEAGKAAERAALVSDLAGRTAALQARAEALRQRAGVQPAAKVARTRQAKITNLRRALEPKEAPNAPPAPAPEPPPTSEPAPAAGDGAGAGRRAGDGGGKPLPGVPVPELPVRGPDGGVRPSEPGPARVEPAPEPARPPVDGEGQGRGVPGPEVADPTAPQPEHVTPAGKVSLLGAIKRVGNAAWNYLGGKKVIIRERGYDDFIRPDDKVRKVTDLFAGSGLVSQTLKAIAPGAKRQLNDLNPEVVNFHTTIRDNPAAVTAHVHRALDSYRASVMKPEYSEEQRQTAALNFEHDFGQTPEGRAAAFHLRFSELTGGALGKGAPTAEAIPKGVKWEGLHARGRKGEDIVQRLKDHSAKNIADHSRDLQGAEITNKDAREVLDSAEKGDFVPVDPPYPERGATEEAEGEVMTYGYGDDLATLPGALAFIHEHVVPAAARGVRIAYTNYDIPALRQALEGAGFTVKRVSRQGQHGKVVHELVATNSRDATITDARRGVPPPAPVEGQAPAEPGAPAPVVHGVRPVEAPAGAAPVRGGRVLPESTRKLLDADAATVKGVTVEHTPEGTVLRLAGVDAPVPVVPDPRPAGQRSKTAWLASALSGSGVKPADVARALASIIRGRGEAPPKWLEKPTLTRQELVDGWNKLRLSKVGGAQIEALMDKSPVLAAVIDGEPYGAEKAIALTPNYTGKSIREETWHLGWAVLPDALKREVLGRLPPSKREAALAELDLPAEKRGNVGLEEGTALLGRLWDSTFQRGQKPQGWFGRILSAIRTKVAKVLPFLRPHIDPVQEVAKEFGTGEVFKRLNAAGEKAPEEAGSVQLNARREAAAATDEGRTTWEKQNQEAQDILQDGEKLNEAIRKSEAKGDLSNAEAKAINLAAEESAAHALGLLGRERSLEPALRDYAAWAALRVQVNRDAGQRLNALRDDRNEPALARVMSPLFKMSGKWAQEAQSAATPAEREAVVQRWNARNARILDSLAARGIDLRGLFQSRAFDGMEADAVNLLRYELDSEIQNTRTAKERWADAYLLPGRVVSDLVMRNLLGLQSAAPQALSSAYFVSRSGVRGAIESLSHHIDGLDPEVLAGLGGRAGAAKHFVQATLTGVKMGLESVYTGNSVAKPKLLGRESSDEMVGNQEYRSFLQDIGETIKMPLLGTGLRVGVGPGLEAVRFVDEMTWATTFDMARRTSAAGRSKADGRPLEDAMQDQDIMEEAASVADRVTQRTRPDEKTAFGKLFRAVEVLRSPTLGGAAPYNPLFHFMPIFRSVALLTGEAGKLIAAPVRGMQAGVNLRTLRSPEALSKYAAEQGIGEGEARRALTQRVMDQMTDATIGMVGYGLVAALLDQDLLPAPRGGTESPAETNVRDQARAPGRLAGIPLQRLSPVYEVSQAFASAREFLKGRESGAEAVTGLGRALLERPLLGGVKGVFGNQTNPATGEKMSALDYGWSQVKRQIGGVGGAYASAARAYESEQKAAGDPDQLISVGGERVTRYGLTGEPRSTPTGILTRGLLGNLATAGANEKRVAELLVKLNDTNLAELNKDRPAGSRIKAGEAGFWPGRLNSDLPDPEDRRFVERMTPAQQSRLAELTGRAWWKQIGPQLSRIEAMAARDPKRALDLLKQTRQSAAQAARATVLREAASAPAATP
jgi:site-specific DNA-adenine methylase